MLGIKFNLRKPEGNGKEFIWTNMIDCTEALRLTTCVEALFLGKWCILGEVK